MTSPNPTWKPGDKIDSPVREMVTVDPGAVTAHDFYKLMIGSIIPRPIALVSTLSKNGVGNLAPFSFFNGVSSNPPSLMISVSNRGPGQQKDTLRNILETGEFVVNTCSEWFAEAMVFTAGEFPYGVDEMQKVGLTAVPSQKVKPPRVKESPVHFECSLLKSIEIGEDSEGSTTVVFGRILLAHVYSEAYQAGRILAEKLKPISRLGGFGYSTLGTIFNLQPPKV